MDVATVPVLVSTPRVVFTNLTMIKKIQFSCCWTGCKKNPLQYATIPGSIIEFPCCDRERCKYYAAECARKKFQKHKSMVTITGIIDAFNKYAGKSEPNLDRVNKSKAFQIMNQCSPSMIITIVKELKKQFENNANSIYLNEHIKSAWVIAFGIVSAKNYFPGHAKGGKATFIDWINWNPVIV